MAQQNGVNDTKEVPNPRPGTNQVADGIIDRWVGSCQEHAWEQFGPSTKLLVSGPMLTEATLETLRIQLGFQDLSQVQEYVQERVGEEYVVWPCLDEKFDLVFKLGQSALADA